VGLFELAVVMAWSLILAICWAGYQLVAQNGRLLLRVEGLERHLGELEGMVPSPNDDGVGSEDAAGAEQTWLGAESPPIGVPAGTVLHDFELPDLDGRQHLRSDWLGQRFLLTFVSPGCVHSRRLLADLAALQAVPVQTRPAPVLVSTGPADESRRLIAETGLEAPLLIQEEMEVGALFEVGRTPTAYLVDEDGRTLTPLVAGRVAILGLAASSELASDGTTVFPPPSLGLIEAATSPAPVNGARFQAAGLEIGSVAPDFRLPGLDGREVALGLHRGQPVLVAFMDPACPPCDEVVPALERAHRQQSRTAVTVIPRGSLEANRAWADEHGLTLPIGLQSRWDTSRAYGILATPAAFLIDERGAIAAPVALGADAILDLVQRVSSTSDT
jgi:peroxiredoxin